MLACLKTINFTVKEHTQNKHKTKIQFPDFGKMVF